MSPIDEELWAFFIGQESDLVSIREAVWDETHLAVACGTVTGDASRDASRF